MKNLNDIARDIMNGKTLNEGEDPLKTVNDLGPAIVHPLQARGKNYDSGVSNKDSTIPGSNKPDEKFNPTNMKTKAPGDVDANANSKDHSIPGSEKAGEKFDPTNKGKGPDLSGTPADGPQGGKGKGEKYNPTNRSQSVKEEVLAELSKKTLGKYIVSASRSATAASADGERAYQNAQRKKMKPTDIHKKAVQDLHKSNRVGENREKGIERAVNRLTKEDIEAIEQLLGGEINEENLETLDENQFAELMNILDADGTLVLEDSDKKDDDDDDSDDDSKSDKDDDDDSDDKKDDKKDSKEDRFKKLKEESDKAIKEHVDAMLSGENLTEEFQKKAKTIFEAAVAEREAVLREEIESEFASKLEESVQEIKADLEGKVDDYMSYVAKEWLKENEVAVESGLKVSLSDDFLNGLRNLFIEHHIDIPTEKVDVVEELSNEVEELEAKINEEIEKNIKSEQMISGLVRKIMVSESCEGLTSIQASKLVKLAEGIQADSDEDFEAKLNVIRESYTGTKAPIGKSVTEDKDPAANDKQETLSEDDPMNKYVTAVKRVSPWQKK